MPIQIRPTESFISEVIEEVTSDCKIYIRIKKTDIKRSDYLYTQVTTYTAVGHLAMSLQTRCWAINVFQ